MVGVTSVSTYTQRTVIGANPPHPNVHGLNQSSQRRIEGQLGNVAVVYGDSAMPRTSSYTPLSTPPEGSGPMSQISSANNSNSGGSGRGGTIDERV